MRVLCLQMTGIRERVVLESLAKSYRGFHAEYFHILAFYIEKLSLHILQKIIFLQHIPHLIELIFPNF